MQVVRAGGDVVKRDDGGDEAAGRDAGDDAEEEGEEKLLGAG